MTSKPNIFVWQGAWHGGAERVTLTVARALLERGFPVTLGVYQVNSQIRIPQLTHPHLMFVPSSLQSLVASIWFRLWYAARFKAVYAHTLGLWKTKHNRIYIHEAADLDTKRGQLHGRQRALYSVWSWLYLQLCLRQAEIVFAATAACRRYLERHGIESEHIQSSGSFYDDSIFIPVHRYAPHKPLRLVVVGNYRDSVKKFRLVRTLFYKNENVRVHIFGGPTRNIDHNFIFHGYTPPTELAAGLADSDVYFMPSLSEGFSIALLEAAATGIPCLVATTALPDPLVNWSNIVPFKTPAEALRKIAEIEKNFELFAHVDAAVRNFSESAVVAEEIRAIAATIA